MNKNLVAKELVNIASLLNNSKIAGGVSLSGAKKEMSNLWNTVIESNNIATKLMTHYVGAWTPQEHNEMEDIYNILYDLEKKVNYLNGNIKNKRLF